MLPGLPLSAKQIVSIVESRHHRASIWSGAVRSGKTIASLVAFLLALPDTPPTGPLVVVAGRTLQTIERNLIEPLQDPALFGAVSATVQHTRGSSIATILGRTVHLIGANDARSEGRLRGLTACLAYVDEATLVPNGFFTQLLARLSAPGARLLASTNPDNPAHWLRKQFIVRAGELGMGHWHFTLDDNPSLSPDYVRAIKAEFTGLWYKRMIEGLWVAAEGAIYDMWDEDRHIVDEIPPIARWVAVGVDYGTSNPFAALALGLGVDNRLYVVDEYRYDSRQRHRQLTDAQYVTELRAWVDRIEVPGSEQRVDPYSNQPVRADRLHGIVPEMIAVDPSAASFIVALSEDEAGLLPTKARNDVLDGIRTVASLLSLDRLRVHSRCRALIDEFGGYAWDDKKAQAGEDVPIKADDHSLDALRYAVFTSQGSWRPHVMWDLAA